MSPRILCCLFLLAGLALYVRAHADAPDEAAVVLLMQQHVDKNAPGTGVAAAVLSGGEIRTYFHGSSGNPRDPSIHKRTIFEIGSVTKTFTAALLLDMVNRGEVSLGSTLESSVPQDAQPAAQKPRLVTLEDLAMHRSGLPRLPDGSTFARSLRSNPANPYVGFTEQDLWSWLSGRRIRGVGEKYEYSNVGMGLLGAVLARRLGMSYEGAVRARILDPLEMRDTFILPPADAVARTAQPHDDNHRPTPPWDMATLAGAGALRSTLADMTRYLAANMDAKPPLSSLLHQPRANADARETRIGLAWMVSSFNGRTIVWHNGGTGGSHSFVGFEPATKRGVVLLTNSSVGTADQLALRLLGVL